VLWVLDLVVQVAPVASLPTKGGALKPREKEGGEDTGAGVLLRLVCLRRRDGGHCGL